MRDSCLFDWLRVDLQRDTSNQVCVIVSFNSFKVSIVTLARVGLS